MPSVYKLMMSLETEFNKMKSKLKEILSEQKYLCVTTDVWTSHAQSYLGATVHFLSENFERQSYVLAFRELKEKQTYNVLANALQAIFDDFGIDIKRIRHNVTDGGSNFCKMFKEYGKPIEASTTSGSSTGYDDEMDMDDSFTNDCEDDSNDEETDDGPTFMEDTNGDEFQSEILNLNNYQRRPALSMKLMGQLTFLCNIWRSKTLRKQYVESNYPSSVDVYHIY